MNIIPYALIVVVLLHGSSFCMDENALGLASPNACKMKKDDDVKLVRYNYAEYKNGVYIGSDQEKRISCSLVVNFCIQCQVEWLFGGMMDLVVNEDSCSKKKD